ncbi:MAG: PIG-L deacetylase family protein [Janthinobacterium lividum]
MSTGETWARRLAAGGPIEEPVAVVVAHPDDETLWTGSALRRLRDATLVVVTDGAPEDMGDAHRLGFRTRADYASARATELDAALLALEFAGRLVQYEVQDQGTAAEVASIADRLTINCAGAAVIVTHPYEGGHPDHDSVALASRIAADRLRVPVVEFACYARFDGSRVFARFVDDADRPEYRRPLDTDDRARVERALQAHASQQSVFGTWRPDVERWRAAPRYDFGRPPPGEAVLYDEFDWTMTAERWRAIVRTALDTTAWV